MFYLKLAIIVLTPKIASVYLNTIKYIKLLPYIDNAAPLKLFRETPLYTNNSANSYTIDISDATQKKELKQGKRK